MSQHDPNQPQWGSQQPGQQPQWGQPGYQAPPQPPKKHTVRNVFIGIGGVLVALIVVGVAVGGGDDKKSDTAKDAPAASTSASKAPAENADADHAAKPKAKPAEKKKPVEAKSYGDGDYKVGTDIPAGTYESAGASDSVVPLCAITTEPTGSSTLPQAKAANKPNQRIIITLKDADGVVTVQGCKALKARQ